MGNDLNGKNLGPGITQRKDGMYVGRTMVSGVRIAVYSMSLNKCKEELKHKKNNVTKDVLLGIDVKKSRTITLNEWFNEWFSTYKTPYLKPGSVTSLKTKYRMTFGKVVGTQRLRDITNIELQKAILKIKDSGQSVSAMKEGLSLLTSCLDIAKNNNLLTGNPALGLRVPWTAKKRESRVLSVDEQRLFLAACEDNWYNEMFCIMFGTGVRIGELGGLKWENINWRKKVIEIRKALMAQYEEGEKKIEITSTKTVNSVRDIPFFPGVEEALLKQKEKQEARIKELGKKRWRQEGELSNFVFTTTFGSPIIRHIAEREINKVTRIINDAECISSKDEGREPVLFKRVYPHAIRHTFCTRLFEKGMDPKIVQKIMGHAYLSTTMDIYTHVCEDKLFDELRNLDDIIRV